MSGVVRWEDPPPHGNRSQWQPVAEALRERPGEWALIAEGLKSGSAGAMSNAIKVGRFSCWRPAGTFESRTSARGDGLTDLYARYVGGDSCAS